MTGSRCILLLHYRRPAAEGLVRGQAGTVLETWVPGVYEVEFCDENDKTHAMVGLRAEQLIRLHHKPVHQAA